MGTGQTRLKQKADLNPVASLNELIIDNVIPKSTEEAIKDKNCYEAMKLEYNSLDENIVWELVDNQVIKPTDSSWHFALKCGPSGEIMFFPSTRRRLQRDLFTDNAPLNYQDTFKLCTPQLFSAQTIGL